MVYNDVRPLSIGMTPSFYTEDNALLKMQLNSLSKQIFKDFDVWLIDVHYDKRKNIVPELAELYKLDIKHIPYRPNQNIAKKLDCSIFNAIYCYSQSPRIVRFSCYRFVREDFTELCNEQENLINVDFYTHNIRPKDDSEKELFSKVWDNKSENVNWSLVPKDCNTILAAWTKESDIDRPKTIHPPNCWGNFMIWRQNWLSINGTDEVFSNTDHYEDIILNIRAKKVGFQTKRWAHKMYRLHHFYGAFSQRANVQPDYPCKQMCDKCKITSVDKGRELIPDRINKKELIPFYDEQIVVCNDCGLSGPMVKSSDYVEFVRQNKIYSTILPSVKIGRNLQILSEDMDKVSSLESKFDIFNNSWENERYYKIIS